MRDYNFFSVYIDDKDMEKKKKVYAIAVGVILASLVTGIISYNYIRIKGVEKDITSIERVIRDEDIVRENNNVISKKVTIKSMMEYSGVVGELGTDLDSEYLKYTYVFDTIGDSLPEKVYISQMDINRDSATISGTTSDRTKVAYFQHNLRGKKAIRDVVVSIIHNDEDQKTYSFNIKCLFKDVIKNESN